MVSDKVIMADSAQPSHVKIAMLSQELVRMMKNVSRDSKTQKEERLNVLNCFMVKMAKSRHSEATMYKVLKAGLRGYYKMVISELKGFSKINRSVDMGRREREIRKILGPTEWFQPRCLQSPEVYSKKEEEVAVTSKSRSAHTLGKGGQKGKFKPTGGKCSLYEGVVFVPSTPGSLLWKELQK